MAEFSNLVQELRQNFETGTTRSYAYRVEQLRKLKQAIKERESIFLDALKSDLNKPSFEAYGGEVGFVYEEINYCLKRLKRWMKPKRVPTPLIHQPSRSYILSEPYGVALIVGPWNYPFQLLLSPLVGAISAGNLAVLKPSELAPATAKAITEMVGEVFPKDVLVSVQGAVEETTALLREQFDYIFFTGSIGVGKVVMKAAAEHLTPVTLELGGKSPCVVDKDIDVAVAARRIAWGKFFNAGQTCVSPDYLLVHEQVADNFIQKFRDCVREFFGPTPQTSPDYSRIINQRHFDRLTPMVQGDVVFGGENERDSLYLAPTLIQNVALSHPAMQEEIFGPILPVIRYQSLNQVLDTVSKFSRPLAFYLFSRSKALEQSLIEKLPFGGGCINNTLVHLSNPHLPFGGIGPSGVGAYHGQFSFETFSHKKAILKSPFFFDIRLKYPPYKNRTQLLKRLQT